MYRIPPRRIGSRAIRTYILASAFGLVGWLVLPNRLWNQLEPTARAASPFTVNSLADTPDATPGNGTCADAVGNCTLRAAIQEAISFAGDDTINFSVMGTINLNSALPDIGTNLIIMGPGANTLTVQRSFVGGTPNFRIFRINSNAVVTLSGMTITNGRGADGAPGTGFGGGQGDSGGGILNNGTLTLADVVVTGNRTGNGGTEVNTSGGFGGFGGGIYSAGPLTMTNTVVSNNTAGNGGIGNSGGSGGRGAGIFFIGPGSMLAMTNCVVVGNTGGNAVNGTTGSGGSGGAGGGIYIESGTANLTTVTVSGNNGGSAAPNTSGTGGQGGGIMSLGTTTMSSCTVSNNGSGQGGTGFSGQGGFGGGINNAGPMVMDGCTVNDNFTRGPNVGGGAHGGGIFNGNSLTMRNCTISGNQANSGGGIFNFSPLTMSNCTISGNRADSNEGRGGGINHNSSTIALTNCTITGNTAYTLNFQNGQGLNLNNAATANVRNTVIAGNGSGSVPDVTGDFNSQGHNLIGKATAGSNHGGSGDQSGFVNGSNGDQVGTLASPIDPLLGPLANNGGATLVHALLANSPAFDAGDNCVTQAAHCGDANITQLITDQRGAMRLADSPDADATATVDIGAFEWQPSLENVSDRTTLEDTSLSVAFGVGDGVTISSVTASSDNQTLLPNANLSVTGSTAVRTLQIIPAPNQSGTANITLTTNGSNGVVNDSFLLTVTSVNDAPIFTKGADPTVNEDSGPQTIVGWASNISAGGNEAGQSLTFLVTGNTNAALFSAAPAVSPSGTLTFTPAANANGNATITLVLKDDGGTANGGQDTTAAQTFIITVTAVNDPPVATDQNLTINEDAQTFVGLSGSDIEGGQLTFSIVSAPSHGVLSGSGSSRFYTPALNFSGSDSFSFKVTDSGGADSAPATVSFTINAVNDSPLNSIPGAQVTNQNTSLVFSSARSNAISVSDVDALGTDAIKVTLTATRGVVSLGGTTGLTFVTGDGVEDLNMTFTGIISDINAALNGVTFKPDDGTNGNASLRITTDDQGHNGSGGARTDIDTIAIFVRSGGLLQFSALTFTVNENGGVASILVTRLGSAFGAASVNYATANGSAVGGAACGPGVNYVSSSGTISWVDGDSNFKTFTIPICDDSLISNGTVNLSLSTPGGSAALGARTTATLTITNDGPPVILTEFNSQKAVALDSVRLTRDPFSLHTSSVFNPDGRTRIMLYVWGLGLRPSDNLSDVFVQASDVQGNVYSLPVEYLGPLPGLDGITEVVVLLPETVLGAPRDLFVTIRLRGPVSNSAIISIAAP